MRKISDVTDEIDDELDRIKMHDEVDRRREESEKKKIRELSRYAYTWSAMGFYSFKVISYTIQKYIKSAASDFMEEENQVNKEFEYGYNQHTEILTTGRMIFTLGNEIFVYTVNEKFGTNSINSNHDIGRLVETLKKEIRENNPLRNKHVQVVSDKRDMDFYCLFKKPPSITFDCIVMDEAMKDDIYDNTIFHLKNLRGNNGIILYGEPGTGKSMICQAVINAGLKEGLSTCFVTTSVDYSVFDEFLRNFLGKCVIVFEDIDSIGQDRKHVLNDDLSDFLQFISGLYERDDGIVFIATTNYIEHLDRAIVSRPVRFNRKYKIELPLNNEIEYLVSLYFGQAAVEPELCYGKKFTGAHIKEIHRTAELLSQKRGVTIADTFRDAVNLVEKNFVVETSSPGF